MMVGFGHWLARHELSLGVLLPVRVSPPWCISWDRPTIPPMWTIRESISPRLGLFSTRAELSPYTYIYDHAPAGWVQIGFWSAITNGFNRYDSALEFGAEVMAIAKIAASALVYALGRRLGFSRPAAAFATILFGFCPLGLVFGRWVFLDNIMIVWLLVAFVLAYAPSRTIGAATAATLAFAMAVLTKETALIILPAFAWALGQNRSSQPPAASHGLRLLRSAVDVDVSAHGLLQRRVVATARAGEPAWHGGMAAHRSPTFWLEAGSSMSPAESGTLLSQWFCLRSIPFGRGIVVAPPLVIRPRLAPFDRLCPPLYGLVVLLWAATCPSCMS